MRYSRLPIIDIVSYCLSQGREGEFWDFKQEWHSDIKDLIKDIICFANTVHDENCYLIFGIADDLTLTGMQQTRRKQADIIDALSNLVYAGDNVPSISIKTITYKNVELDILVIYDTSRTPIYLKKTYGDMIQGCIYARVGDRNTPNRGNADITTIENLWRKHLGLTKPPIEYIFDSLSNKLEWSESENGFYNIYRPEFSIQRIFEEEYEMNRGADEFYSYAQTNESTSYYMLNIIANGTSIDTYQVVNLDSGRLSIPVAEWGFVHFDNPYSDVVGYKYYIVNSHLEKLLRFMYDPQNMEERWAFRNYEKLVLFFESESEKLSFEEYVDYHKAELKSRVELSSEYDHIVTENVTKTNGCKRSLRTSIVLKDMLEEYRKIQN